MKRILWALLCPVMIFLCAVSAHAEEAVGPLDATQTNIGPSAGNAFLIFALVVALLGGVYLFFKLRK